MGRGNWMPACSRETDGYSLVYVDYSYPVTQEDADGKEFPVDPNEDISWEINQACEALTECVKEGLPKSFRRVSSEDTLNHRYNRAYQHDDAILFASNLILVVADAQGDWYHQGLALVPMPIDDYDLRSVKDSERDRNLALHHIALLAPKLWKHLADRGHKLSVRDTAWTSVPYEAWSGHDVLSGGQRKADNSRPWWNKDKSARDNPAHRLTEEQLRVGRATMALIGRFVKKYGVRPNKEQKAALLAMAKEQAKGRRCEVCNGRIEEFEDYCDNCGGGYEYEGAMYNSDSARGNPALSAKDQKRLRDANAEIFHLSANEARGNRAELVLMDRKAGKHAGWHAENAEHNGLLRAGWYYWCCLPGCLPEGSASGPFPSEHAAAKDCIESWGLYDQ